MFTLLTLKGLSDLKGSDNMENEKEMNDAVQDFFASQQSSQEPNQQLEFAELTSEEREDATSFLDSQGLNTGVPISEGVPASPWMLDPVAEPVDSSENVNDATAVASSASPQM